MKTRIWMSITAITLFAALAIPIRLAGQEESRHHDHYKLIDLGTLGGPHSYGSVNGGGFEILNKAGVISSSADTSVADPGAPSSCFNPDCFLTHAFRWKEGVMTDLGALPGLNNSAAGSINAHGWSTGQSQNGQFDPIAPFPEVRAVLWKNDEIIDLGTLGGNESLGIYVNDAGQVIGFATINTVPDPFSFLGAPTHTFIWQDGEKVDLGTLGGPDAFPNALCANRRTGLVVGSSFTSATPNPDGLPTADPFLWDDGSMIDLGTLGGTNGFAQCANNRRQVIGQSSLAGSSGACSSGGGAPGCHPFFWEHGVMTDLGTFGGDNGQAAWINAAGDVVGSADFPGNQIHDAALWRDGKIHDLGTVPGDACSRASAISARGQVIGGSSDCRNFLHAFLWEEGGPMLDLNTLIPPGSGLQLTNAISINERGEIVAKSVPLGVTPIDDQDLGHLVLLIPCDAEDEGCEVDEEAAATGVAPRTLVPILKSSTTTTTPPQRRLTPSENVAAWRARMARQYHIAGFKTPKD